MLGIKTAGRANLHRSGPWNHETTFHRPRPNRKSWCGLSWMLCGWSCQILAQEYRPQRGRPLGAWPYPHEHWYHQHKHGIQYSYSRRGRWQLFVFAEPAHEWVQEWGLGCPWQTYPTNVKTFLLSADKFTARIATDLLKDRNGECSSFASARLCLCNHIVSFDDGYDRTLLDSRRSFETGRVYSFSSLSILSKTLTRKRKCLWVTRALNPCCRSWISDIRTPLFKRLIGRNRNALVNDLVPVGLDLIFGDILKFFSRCRQWQVKKIMLESQNLSLHKRSCSRCHISCNC